MVTCNIYYNIVATDHYNNCGGEALPKWKIPIDSMTIMMTINDYDNDYHNCYYNGHYNDYHDDHYK